MTQSSLYYEILIKPAITWLNVSGLGIWNGTTLRTIKKIFSDKLYIKVLKINSVSNIKVVVMYFFCDTNIRTTFSYLRLDHFYKTIKAITRLEREKNSRIF